MVMIEWTQWHISPYQLWMELGHLEMNGMVKMCTSSCSNIPTLPAMETMQIGPKALAQ